MIAPKSVGVIGVRLFSSKESYPIKKQGVPRSRRRSASSITKCLIDRREKPFVFSRWSGGGQCMKVLIEQGFSTEQSARGGTAPN